MQLVGEDEYRDAMDGLAAWQADVETLNDEDLYDSVIAQLDLEEDILMLSDIDVQCLMDELFERWLSASVGEKNV